jgi:hypothetical protein
LILTHFSWRLWALPTDLFLHKTGRHFTILSKRSGYLKNYAKRSDKISRHLLLRKEDRLKVFKNRVSRRISGQKRQCDKTAL